MSGQHPEHLIPLAPLRMAGMFETAARFIVRQPGTVLGLGAIAGFVTALANLVALGTVYPELQDRVSALEPLAADPQAADQTLLAQVLIDVLVSATGMVVMVALLSLPVSALVNAMLIHMLGRDVFGQSTNLGEAWAGVRRMAWRVLGQAIMIVALLTVCGLPLVVALGMAGRDPLLGLGLTFLLAPLCLVAALMLAPRLLLAPVCLVLEDLTVGESFVRARQLARGHAPRILGIGIAAWLISRLVGAVISLPFDVFAGAEALTTQAVFLTSLGRMAGSTFSLPVLSAVIAVLYIDLRVRKEGLGQAVG